MTWGDRNILFHLSNGSYSFSLEWRFSLSVSSPSSLQFGWVFSSYQQLPFASGCFQSDCCQFKSHSPVIYRDTFWLFLLCTPVIWKLTHNSLKSEKMLLAIPIWTRCDLCCRFLFLRIVKVLSFLWIKIYLRLVIKRKITSSHIFSPYRLEFGCNW